MLHQTAREGPRRTCPAHPGLATHTLPLPWSACTETTAWTRAGCPLTSTLEEVAVDILYGGIDGRPGGDTSRSDVRVILGIYILKSFPGNSRMELWKIPNK